jgi:hypothetical protein
MSHMGQSRPNWAFRAMSGLPPIATELRTSLVVRFVAKNHSTKLNEDNTEAFDPDSLIGLRR